MGVDIHVYSMARKNADENYHAVILNEPRTFNHDDNGKITELDYLTPYNGRDYDLFGLLAGVRGEEDEFTEVRGLRTDLPGEIQAEWDRYEDSYFSPTWYTCKELAGIVNILRNRYEKAQVEAITRLRYDKDYTLSEYKEDLEDSIEYDDYMSFKEFYDSILAYASIARDYDFLYNDGIVVMWFDC